MDEPLYQLSPPNPAGALLRALADRARLAILSRLAEGAARVVDLTKKLGLPRSTVSSHLARLRDYGLLGGRAEGRQVANTLSHDEILHLLPVAEAPLAATAEAALPCPNYGERARSGDEVDELPLERR